MIVRSMEVAEAKRPRSGGFEIDGLQEENENLGGSEIILGRVCLYDAWTTFCDKMIQV